MRAHHHCLLLRIGRISCDHETFAVMGASCIHGDNVMVKCSFCYAGFFCVYTCRNIDVLSKRKDCKARKSAFFLRKIYTLNFLSQHTDIQGCSEGTAKSFGRGQKNIAIIELNYRDNWSQISRYFFRLERTTWEVRTHVLKKSMRKTWIFSIKNMPSHNEDLSYSRSHYIHFRV